MLQFESATEQLHFSLHNVLLCVFWIEFLDKIHLMNVLLFTSVQRQLKKTSRGIDDAVLTLP